MATKTKMAHSADTVAWLRDQMRYECERRDRKIQQLEDVLRLIYNDGCQRYAGGFSCRKVPSRRPDAEFTVDRWCDSCIAEEALLHLGIDLSEELLNAECICGEPLPLLRPGDTDGHWCADLDRLVARIAADDGTRYTLDEVIERLGLDPEQFDGDGYAD